MVFMIVHWIAAIRFVREIPKHCIVHVSLASLVAQWGKGGMTCTDINSARRCGIGDGKFLNNTSHLNGFMHKIPVWEMQDLNTALRALSPSQGVKLPMPNRSNRLTVPTMLDDMPPSPPSSPHAPHWTLVRSVSPHRCAMPEYVSRTLFAAA